MDAGAELAESPGFVELALADASLALDEVATQEKERAGPATTDCVPTAMKIFASSRIAA